MRVSPMLLDMAKRIVLVATALVLIGCSANKPDPTYAARVKEFGTPDLIADHSGGTSRYYSAQSARSRPPRAYEVYYYLKDNKQIAFQQNAPPMESPVPPTMEDFLARMKKQVQE
jgi:hypothetical protein